MPHQHYAADTDLDEDILGDDEDLFGDEDDDLLGDDDEDLFGDEDDDEDLFGDEDDDDDLLGDDYDDDDDDELGFSELDALESDVGMYGAGGEDDDLWDDMMHQADSGPQGYSTTALSYMSPAEIEDDLLSPYALQEMNPMGSFPGHGGLSEDEFGAEMEMEEAEEFGVVGLAVAAASMLALPVATTAAVGLGTAATVAAGPVGITALIAGLAGQKKKYLRITTRLTKLAEKDKMDSPKWARNAGRLRATWRKLKKRGKTGGMQSPTQILQALRGGSRSSVFQKANQITQSGRAGTPKTSLSPQQKAQIQRRRQHRRRQMMMRRRRQQQQASQAQSMQPSATAYQTGTRRGIRPHQMRQMQREAATSNFALRSGQVQPTMGPPPGRHRRSAGYMKPKKSTYTPTAIDPHTQAALLQRRQRMGSYNTTQNVSIPSGYTLSPDFGTVIKEHPFKSFLALGGVFAVGVMLSKPTKNMVSGLTDRYRG